MTGVFCATSVGKRFVFFTITTHMDRRDALLEIVVNKKLYLF